MITLPVPPRLAHLKVFGILLSLVAGGVVAIALSAATGANRFPTWVIASSLMGALSVTVARQLEWIYTRWNSGVRWLSRIARVAISGACFLICVAIPKDASRFQSKPASAGASNWVKTPPVAGDLNRSASASGSLERQAAWALTYGTWAPRSGNGWAIVLLPFLALLSLFSADEDDSVPVRNYTLF